MSVVLPIVTEFNSKGIDRAVKEFQSLEGAGKKAQFALKKAFVPAAAALGGLTAAAIPAIEAASDLGENMSKVGVIFGDGSAEIEKFAATAAKKLGQSKNAVLQAAGTFGTFGKAAGLGGKELATFSNDFTALASDLASFNNTTPEQAVQAIGAALRGESEPLRQYGVLLNDAKLKAAALELGIYDGNGALTDQQKILAAQKVIFQETTAAQGDFERTSSGLANTQRSLTAQMENLQVSIGQALLPVVQAILPYVTNFADWATNNSKTFLIIAGTIGAIAGAVVSLNVAMKVWSAIQTLATAATWAWNAALAANPLTLVILAIVALSAALVVAYKRFETVREVVDTVFKFIKTAVTTGIDAITTYLETVLGIYKTIFNTIAKLWNNTIGKLSFNVPDWVPFLGGKGWSVPKIPMLAEGGIVSKPTLAMIGEAGPEAVVPLNRGGMGPTYNITINGGLSGSADIGRAVVDAIKSFNRQNGPALIQVA